MARILAITNGYVVPVAAEPIENGTVLIEDGVITAVGTDVGVPEGTETVDAEGRWVLPGFVEAHGHIGIHEEGEGWAGNDTNEMTDPNGPACARSTHPGRRRGLPRRARRRRDDGGHQARLGQPDRRPDRRDQDLGRPHRRRAGDQRPVSVKSALGENPKRVYGDKKQLPSTRLGVANVIREAFVDAQNYVAKRDAAAEGQAVRPRPRQGDAGARARGRAAWDQHTHRADDIATAIRLSEEFGYRLVVNHGTEGHLIADVLAEKRHPGHLRPDVHLALQGRAAAPREPQPRADGGGRRRVAITTDHPVVPINFLVHQASFAVKDGLPARPRSRRSRPTRRRSWGSTTAWARSQGLDGDVVLWSGDPLDVDSARSASSSPVARSTSWDPAADAGRGAGRVVERTARLRLDGPARGGAGVNPDHR